MTKKGEKARERLAQRAATQLPAPKEYEKQEARSSFTMVAFDVPEKERRKRVWLREVLRRLGFSQLQKSVWIGKTGVPEEFIEDIRNLKLVSYIEILEIGKKGTLEKIL